VGHGFTRRAPGGRVVVWLTGRVSVRSGFCL